MKKAQNIVEFVFLFPIIIILVLMIFELAMIWHKANTVEMLNQEISSNIDMSVFDKDLSREIICPAINEIKEILKEKSKVLNSREDWGFDVRQEADNKIFKKYTLVSKQTFGNDSESIPIIKLYVDCRNPYQQGILTQMEYLHPVMFFSFILPRFDNKKGNVVIGEASETNNNTKKYVRLVSTQGRTQYLQ